MRSVYFDNAASSWPKPDCVLESITHWYQELGVDAQRGSSARHQEMADAVLELRAALAGLTGLPQRNVVLCSGATEAMNLFLKGFLHAGDTVWSTTLEHNAVIRPLVRLREQRGIRVHFLDVASQNESNTNFLSKALEQGPPPKLLVLNHASNVTGLVQELPRLLEMARDAGITTLVDAAQSAGRLDLRGLGADAVVLSGHKGLMGPPGVGALCMREDFSLTPLKEGGTGSSTASDQMPARLPFSLESGTPNSPGYLGWLAGIRWVQEQGMSSLHEAELALNDRLWRALEALEEKGRLVRHCASLATLDRVAILSLSFPEHDPVELAMILDQEGIFVRAGFHCAAYIHQSLGADRQGSLRISPGPFNKTDEIDQLVQRLSAILD